MDRASERNRRIAGGAAIAAAVLALAAGAAAAQSLRPQARPAGLAAPAPVQAAVPAPPPAAAAAAPEPTAPQDAAAPAGPRVAPSGRPLPRFASLKAQEGNARRGPDYDHRIDWVFVRPGMPLRIVAEHEHWRRVEDAEGAGGWIHYSLLSVARTVQVTEDLADIRVKPDDRAAVIARAELGVIARVTDCVPDWCRIVKDGVRGWLPKSALWGVTADETFD